MSINIGIPENQPEVQIIPKIAVVGVGGAGSNAVNNMIESGIEGVRFIVANTDAQALQVSKASERIQLGVNTTGGLGAGSKPEIGRASAEESEEKITELLKDLNMLFIAAGMGGGTGTGAAPVIAKIAKEMGILTIAVVTKPFHFEGKPRMKTAEFGISELSNNVDTLLIIPNQKLFHIQGEDLTIQDAFKKVDDVLSSGIKSITDLMITPGVINLDFADVKTAMEGMGRAMMGTGEESGEKDGEGPAIRAAQKALSNPLLDNTNISDAKAIMVNITCGPTLRISEIDEAVTFIKDEANVETNIMHGLRYDQSMGDTVRISVVATGISENPANMTTDVAEKKPMDAINARKIPFHTLENNESAEKTSPFINHLFNKEKEEEIVTLTETKEIQENEKTEIEVKADEIVPEKEENSSTIISMPSARDLFKSITVNEPEQQTMPFINPEVIPLTGNDSFFKSHNEAKTIGSFEDSFFPEKNTEKMAVNQTTPIKMEKNDISLNPEDKPMPASIMEDIPSFFNEKIPSFFGRK